MPICAPNTALTKPKLFKNLEPIRAPRLRWRHSEGVTHHRRPMRRSRPAAPAFVPIVTDAMPAEAAAPAMLATPVIEVRLAGAVVRVVSGLDDTQLTAVLRAVRASALRA
jgi:transposase